MNHTLFRNVRISLLFIGYRLSFTEQQRRDSENAPSPSAQDKNAWSSYCTPPYTLTA